MGLFDDPGDLFTIWGDGLSPGMADVASSRVGAEIFRAGIEPDVEHEEALARARWLADQRAESSFPCGVVVAGPDTADVPAAEDPWARPRRGPRDFVPVTAVVVPDAVVFFRGPIDGVDAELIVELGRIPRSAITDVDVVNVEGAHVPEPVHETLEPSEPVQLLLRWMNAGAPDEDRFGFRSAWAAWEAGRRLRLAKSSRM